MSEKRDEFLERLKNPISYNTNNTNNSNEEDFLRNPKLADLPDRANVFMAAKIESEKRNDFLKKLQDYK